VSERWLVDGMNVIGSRPDGWWREPERAFRRLRRQLERYARASGAEVRLVLDGRRPAGWAEEGAVETAFARGARGAADDAIVARLAADPHPEAVTVATSDRELAERVTALGARVVGASEFRSRLERPPPGSE
jgi:predicted RNA-binding protein with PIN domain